MSKRVPDMPESNVVGGVMEDVMAPESAPAPTTDDRHLPADHPAVPTAKVGVLLLNLGTPDGTDYWSMRRYLDEFLSDRRIIELSPWIWQPILKGIVLTVRPSRSGKAYREIWNTDADESPLRTITRDQATAVGDRLMARHPNLMVDWAMRYGNPSTGSRIEAMIAAGCRKLLLAPLYPQYSAATTATACDQAFRQLMKERWQPAVRSMPAYFDEPAYVDALAKSIERHYAALDWEPEVLLASFHGLPREYLENGDPYHCQCAKTARLVRERLGWPDDRLRLCFQSRFGPKEWLKPYADETVKELANAGVKRMAIISPGFSADCVETLEELNIGLRELFEEHGGEHFTYVPCLNADTDHITLLTDLIERELAGWI